MSVIFSARSILIAYLTQSAQIHMNSCNTQNTHKMPPDQAWAMKSPTPQIQTENTHTHFMGVQIFQTDFPLIFSASKYFNWWVDLTNSMWLVWKIRILKTNLTNSYWLTQEFLSFMCLSMENGNFYNIYLGESAVLQNFVRMCVCLCVWWWCVCVCVCEGGGCVSNLLCSKLLRSKLLCSKLLHLF